MVVTPEKLLAVLQKTIAKLPVLDLIGLTKAASPQDLSQAAKAALEQAAKELSESPQTMTPSRPSPTVDELNRRLDAHLGVVAPPVPALEIKCFVQTTLGGFGTLQSINIPRIELAPGRYRVFIHMHKVPE